MPAKKVKKFCRVTKFLQQTDKDLHQALDDLCLFGLFRTRGRGVTFLYPVDKSYRKKIIDSAYSNTPEKAVDMIRSLVLLDYLPSPNDFKNKKDDIPNALHKKLDVVSADANEVKLKSGHKLVVDKSFITLRSVEPVAVYKLSGKGELPTTGVSSNMKYNAKTTGGYRGGLGPDKSVEIKLTECVENIYASGKHDIYKTVMALIYNYVNNVRSDPDIKNIITKKICASARASFYNIVAPWSYEKDYNISQMIEDSGIVALVECNDSTVSALIAKHASTYADELAKFVSGNIANDIASRKVLRDELLSKIKNPTSARTSVLEVYGGDSSRLYKDLLTVYCYLAAINEASDSTYFKTSFTFVMKHIFNHNNSFNESVNETVYNLCIYYNLVKSDAFLYKPVVDKTLIGGEYLDLNSQLPDPQDTGLFTIQFNNEVEKRGGGGGGDTFFGGVIDSL